MKAKPLDRVELTRRKMQMKSEQNHFGEVNKMVSKGEFHGDICPFCGNNSLLHESGCVKCTHCGWSACG